MAVSRRLRFEILRRDGHTCRYCGAAAPDAVLTVDHVVPEALGGGSEPENLVTACRDCNAGKSSIAPNSPIVSSVADDALRWAAAMKHAAEIQAQERDAFAIYCDEFYTAWEPTYSLPDGWRSSLATWYQAGAEIQLLYECLDIAFAARGIEWRWKYFCGIVWKKLRERQDIARDLLAQEDSQ